MESSSKSYEQYILQFFNPNDLTHWQNTRPEEFIALVVPELKNERERIQKYAELLRKAPEMESITWPAGDKTVTAKFWIEEILKSAATMSVILDTLRAYGENINKEQS